jgi:hypothetical protein
MNPKNASVTVFKPKTKDSREAAKDFTYDAVYDWK